MRLFARSRVALVVPFVLFGGVEAAQGPLLHAVNSGAGGQFILTIDPTTGASNVLASIGFIADALAYLPDGRLLIADNSAALLREVDPLTGAVTNTIGPFGTPGLIESMAVHPVNGSLWGVRTSSSTLVRIDTVTGTSTDVGSHSTFSGMAGLTWSKDGNQLYGISCHSGTLFRINSQTGLPAAIGPSGLICPLGLATHPLDGRVFVIDWQGGSVDMKLHTLSVTTGAPTLIGSVPQGKQLEGIAFPLLTGQYGHGCAGSGGFVPRLEVSPALPAAQTQVAVTIDDALGGSSAHLFFGLTEVELSMGLGCTLNVAPLFPISLVLPLGGIGAGNGQVTLPGFLPASAAGLTFTMQAFVVDPQGPLGFSNSNGWRVEVQ